jgi:PRC-barrel domain
MNRSEATVHRLHDLLGLPVVAPDGRRLGYVNDVRLSPGPAVRGLHAELVVDGLVVADRHAGSLLGYDRRAEQGPWLVRWAVRALHRKARYVPWRAIRDITWGDGGQVALAHDQREDLGMP